MSVRRSSLVRTVATMFAVLACAAAAAAQTRPPSTAKPRARPHRPAPHAGSIELSGGLAWNAGFDLGSLAATETRNPGTGTSPFELFRTSARVGAGWGGVGRIGYYITPSLAVEGGVFYLKPELSVPISNDVEGAQSLTATETYSRYVFDLSGVWHLRRLSFAHDRGVPFLLGGAGYIRELHDGNELLETGNEYHAGAGIKYFLSPGTRRFGLRGEVSIASRSGAFDFTDGRRTLTRASGSLFVVF